MRKLIFGFMGALALAGCGGGGGNGGGGSSNKARIAYINASPDASILDFRMNNTVRGDDVPYGTATDFESLNPADYDVAVETPDNENVLWSEARTFAADTDNVVVSVGLRTPPSDDTQTPPVVETPKRLVIAGTTINRSKPTGNRARLIILHALVRKAGFPTPAIDFRNPGDTPVVNQGGINYASQSTVDVDSGSQTFQVRQSGTEQVFVERTFTLAPGKVYYALVSGLEGGLGNLAPEIRLIDLPTRD